MKLINNITFSVPMFFQDSGAPDIAALERYLDSICAHPGVGGLFSMAFNTRYMQLTTDEILTVNRLVCDAAKRHRTPVIVGHPLNLTQTELERYCERVARFEPDAVAVLFPERYFSDPAPVLDYLQAPSVAGLPTIIHEMKFVSGFDGSLVNWPDELLDRALELDCVVGIKEDSKDDAISERILGAHRDRINVIIAGGGKARAAALARSVGIRTWLNGSTMLSSAPARAIYTAIIDNRERDIERYLTNIERPYFEQVVAKLGWHVAHKLALEVAGHGSRHERRPMTSASPEAVRELAPTVERVLGHLASFTG